MYICPVDGCGHTTLFQKDPEAFHEMKEDPDKNMAFGRRLKRRALAFLGSKTMYNIIIGAAAFIMVLSLHYTLRGQNEAISVVGKRVDQLAEANSALVISASRIESSAGVLLENGRKMTEVVGALDNNVKGLTSTLGRFQTSTEGLLTATGALTAEVEKSGKVSRELLVAIRNGDKKLNEILVNSKDTAQTIAALDAAVAAQKRENEDAATVLAKDDSQPSKINIRVIKSRNGNALTVSAKRAR